MTIDSQRDRDGAAAVQSDPVGQSFPDDGRPRFVIFLGGLQSHSLETPDDHHLEEDFAPLRRRLRSGDPSLRFVYFSYGVGPRLRAGTDPRMAWRNDAFDDGSEPRYTAVETTDLPLADHLAGLDWLIQDIVARFPRARIDLIGFSLGGIVALAWAAATPDGDAAIAAVHLVVLISSPVGGISPLGLLTPAFGVRHVLQRFHIRFGRSLVLRDLRQADALTLRLREALLKVDVASVENSRDYVVNGNRITGQVVLPVWVRTVSLGKGVAATSFLPADRCYVADLGGWDRHLRTTHHHILRGTSPEIDQVRQHVANLIGSDGAIWISRQIQKKPHAADRPP